MLFFNFERAHRYIKAHGGYIHKIDDATWEVIVI